MSKVKQYRNWFIRCYGTYEQAVAFQLQCNHYAYIYHDKDYFTKSDEMHNTGDKKAPHWHFCANFTDKKSEKAVKQLLSQCFGNGAVGCMCRPMDKRVESAVEYLEHKNNPEKAQYDHSQVFTDNHDFWFSTEVKEQIKEDKQDIMLVFYNDIVDNGLTYEKLHAYCKKYGRDFLFNWKKVFETAQFVAEHKTATDWKKAVKLDNKAIQPTDQHYSHYYDEETQKVCVVDCNGVVVYEYSPHD